MCGIAGIVSKDPRFLKDAVLRRMLSAIRHRGPDDQGWEALPEEGIGLAHSRLSILDLSPAGHQPMWTEDRSVAIVFNGEIYNFRELRKELVDRGMSFRSQCDTEVLLKGYQAWGRAMLHRLNGMFAFAIWDKAMRTIWLARDRMGVKPLYWWRDEASGAFLFASEIKAILQHPAVPRRVDPSGLQSFLSLAYVVSPYTMFAGVRKLPAGHEIVLGPEGAFSLRRWWDVPEIASPIPRSEDERIEEIRRLFREAVERRLVSDVPLGAFLSGGVDSTLIVGQMSRLVKEPVRTFSAAFEVGARSFKYNVDADCAERVAAHFGTHHTRLVIPMEDGLLESIRRCVRTMDEPHGNPTSVTTMLLAERVKREGISVVLSGDGSDEIFGGYSRYQQDLKSALLQRVPAAIRDLVPRGRVLDSLHLGRVRTALAKADMPPLTVERMMTWWWVLGREQQACILAPGYDVFPNAAEEAMAGALSRLPSGWEITNQDAMLYSDLTLWIAEESNMRMDKATMAAALETRAPFLDYRLVEYAMSIPFSRKAGLGNGKRLLKEALRDLLPREVMQRPKWGWFSPVHYWVKDLVWPEAQRLIRDLPGTGVFGDGVRQFAEGYPPAKPMHVWCLFIFALWHKEYME